MAKHVDKQNLEKVVETLRNNGVIAFPTDTVFGLACLLNDFSSIERIKQIKHRDAKKALPIMCHSTKQVQEICLVPEKIKRLMNTIGKGAITYILQRKETLDPRNTNDYDTVAIRIPDDSFILDLITELQTPLLVTSCNVSNEPSLRYHRDVIKQFDDLVDLIVMEDAKSDVSSTIYDTINDRIIREGNISLERIKEILND